MILKKAVLFLIFGLATAIALSQERVPPHPDNSVSLDLYVAMRIPDPRANWSLEDYKKAMKILKQIRGKDKYTLPRKGNPESGIIFDKITDPQIFSPLIDTAIALDKRLLLADQYTALPNDVLSLYKEPFHQTERFGKEVIGCYEFITAFSGTLIFLVDELILTVGKKNAPPDLLSLREDVGAELYRVLMFFLEVLDEDKRRFDLDVQRQLVEKLEIIFPTYWYLLDLNMQYGIIEKVKKIQGEREEDDIKKNMNALVDLLEKE